MPYKVEFSPEALEHLDEFRKFDQQRIIDAVEAHLTHAPSKASRHRKLMRSNLVATRELRVGDFRVYYDVDDSLKLVLIRAIGLKKHGRVFIAGEEADLS
jgi:mRNA-degrading endonuclease RelE of RelBE toxin-antitoxin system